MVSECYEIKRPGVGGVLGKGALAILAYYYPTNFRDHATKTGA